jgi:sigma-B regulation protein RsbU (phosphoserine phosphatase)
MSAESELPSPLKPKSPVEGWWDHAGSRVCFFDVESELSALHWAFFDEVGTSAAHFLYLAGLRAAVALNSSFVAPHQSEGFLKAGLQFLTSRGYGTFLIDPTNAADVYAIRAQQTIEAWAYLRRQDRAAAPVCNYTRGLLAGVACMAVEPTGSPSRNIVCWEIECVAVGGQHCRFLVGSAENLAAQGFQPPNERLSPRWSLEALNAQLRLSADQLQETQKKLLERQREHQQLLDNMVDPLLVLDADGRATFVNLRYLETTGLSAQQAIGSRPIDMVDADDQPKVRGILDRLLNGDDERARFTFRVRTGNQRYILESSARRITGADGRPAIEALCRDVSERERDRLALELANKKLVTKQRIADNDLRLAKLVHESLLPEPIKTDAINVDVRYVPVDRVGGDYCHIANVGGRHVVLTLCDVSGHGVAAALLASRVNSHLQEQELIDPDPWALTLDMNNFLRKHFDETGMFVTFLAITVDTKSLKARICGAGHPGPIIWRKATGDVFSLRSQHLPVGILENFDRSPHFETVQLAPGDRILLYTDGIIDICGREGKPIRTKGLEELVRQSAHTPLFAWGDWLLEQVAHLASVRAHDDMTLMLVEIVKPLLSRDDAIGTV